MGSVRRVPSSPLLLLDPEDDVMVATVDVPAGAAVVGDVVSRAPIPTGHKVAVRAIDAGQPVRKVGLVIGWAAAPIVAGEHLHDHNLTTKGTLPPAVARPSGPASSAPPGRTIRGYVRPDGRVGTRNHLLVITTVNCSATVARVVAAEAGRALPTGIDGVTALLHASGCGLPAHGPQIDRLRRVLAGYATNPNTAGAVVIGLGCEVNQLDAFLDATGLAAGPTLETVVIQDAGGTRAAIDAGVAGALRVAERVAAVDREEVPVRHLVLGVQCGGSDGFSAVTANPALGRAADLLVADGATVLLSETPELSGTEEELVARAVDPAVADTMRTMFAWWRSYAAAGGSDLDANPSPGNRAGGISNIIEKSVGAAAKGGRSIVSDVIGYAEPVRRPGLVIMDSPGYDPASVTGQVASGATLICFTTGRGSCFGSKPAPTVKLSTTTALYERMPDDIDLDCGGILTGTDSVDVAGERIADLLCSVASGQPTASERLGYGDEEFTPWLDGITL
jgi:altronate hydrolase